MAQFVGITEEAERIADSKLSVKYKHIISKSINHAFRFCCMIYAFPISLLSFIPFFEHLYGVILAVGIIFNTISIIIALHTFHLLSSIEAAEMGFISYWLCMAFFYVYEHFCIDKPLSKIAVHDGSTHNIVGIEDNVQKLSAYEQSVFKWFHSTKSYLGKIPKDNHPHYDGIVFHYVLFSTLISITSAYIMDGAIQVFNGVKIISTYSDLYEYIGIIAANIIFGYKLTDFAAKWFVQWYWELDVIAKNSECHCNCKCMNTTCAAQENVNINMTTINASEK